MTSKATDGRTTVTALPIEGAPSTAEPVIRFENVSKRYSSTTVVDNVTLDILQGEIHALVGANGAGKSTLIGMLSGRAEITSGAIKVWGSEISRPTPRVIQALGIATVYQELTVIDTLTAVANVFLGAERNRAGWLSNKEMIKCFNELCARFDVTIDPLAKGADLPVATRQLIEIMRAIRAEARILLLDEPTAALSQSERDKLLAIVTQLAESGITVVLVSHNLGEVLRVSNRVTVMRAGRIESTDTTSHWTRETLIEAMTGDVETPVMRDGRPNLGEIVLEVGSVTVPNAIQDITLHVRAGEIIGLAGLVGSGRTTLLRALAGAERTSNGTMILKGKQQRWPRSVRDAIERCGIALVPEERKAEGVHLKLNVPDNVTLTRMRDVARGSFVVFSRQLMAAQNLLSELQLSRPVGRYAVEDLSGGNQQKVAIAKWLHRSPSVLLFDEPTRGIDVAAKVHVMTAIRRFAREGHAVIMTSSEIEEVLDLSDRLIVLSNGRAVAELDLHERVPTVREVLRYSFEKTE